MSNLPRPGGGALLSMLSLTAALLLSAPAFAEQGEPAIMGPDETSALAKRLQNPVEDVLSLIMDNTSSFGVGDEARAGHSLAVQANISLPAGPFDIVTRTAFPAVVLRPAAGAGEEDTLGVGDLTSTWFLTPAEPCTMSWGVGPAWSVPTASPDRLGAEQLGLGPAALFVASPGPWVFGAQFSWIWAIAGTVKGADLNRTSIRYFIYYNLPRGWYLVTAPVLTGERERPDGYAWTVPFGGGIGKVVRLGFTALEVRIHGYGNAVRPVGAAEATLRVELQLVLPSFY